MQEHNSRTGEGKSGARGGSAPQLPCSIFTTGKITEKFIVSYSDTLELLKFAPTVKHHVAPSCPHNKPHHYTMHLTQEILQGQGETAGNMAFITFNSFQLHYFPIISVLLSRPSIHSWSIGFLLVSDFLFLFQRTLRQQKSSGNHNSVDSQFYSSF